MERRRIKGFRDRNTIGTASDAGDPNGWTTRQRQEQQTGKYRELIGIAEEVLQRRTHGAEEYPQRRMAEI